MPPGGFGDAKGASHTSEGQRRTVLRLPRGTFTPYSQGAKANIIFFQKGRPTERTWIFDARSNVPAITKGRLGRQGHPPVGARHRERYA